MPGSSENFSEKKRRGRPHAFTETEKRFFEACGIGLDCRTRRGKMNHWYGMKAIAALKDDPSYQWLGCGDRAAVMAGAIHYRWTILSELGRIQDPDSIREVARDICREKPKATEAVRMIREIRTGRFCAPSTEGLTALLLRAVDDYRAAHWPTPYSMVRDALHEVEARVKLLESGARAKRAEAKRKKG